MPIRKKDGKLLFRPFSQFSVVILFSLVTPIYGLIPISLFYYLRKISEFVSVIVIIPVSIFFFIVYLNLIFGRLIYLPFSEPITIDKIGIKYGKGPKVYWNDIVDMSTKNEKMFNVRTNIQVIFEKVNGETEIIDISDYALLRQEKHLKAIKQYFQSYRR